MAELAVDQQYVFTPARDWENRSLAVVYEGSCSNCGLEARMRYRQLNVSDFPATLPLSPCVCHQADVVLTPVLPERRRPGCRAMTMTQAEAEAAFAQQRETLAGAVCTLELGFAFTVKGTVQTARIFREESYETKGGNWRTRKVQVGLMLVAPEETPTRAGLLRQLADILETV